MRWPGGQAVAVTLSYDDCLPVHRRTVAPMLSERGLGGTFYLQVGSPDLHSNVDGWRAVAAAGHELGNHSVFHPCRGDVRPELRDWLPPEYDLATYTARRWRDEMVTANFALHLIDGQERRTFGNTCGETEVGAGERRLSLEPMIAELFVAGRGPVTDRPVDPAVANLQSLGCCVGDFKTFDDYRAQVEAAAGSWLIYGIHGVGQGSHSMFVNDRDHERHLDYLADNSRTVWTASLIEVASFIANMA